MTNPELNAWLDKTCFGTDQSQKMCGEDPGTLQHCILVTGEDAVCSGTVFGNHWASCPHRKPYTPPNYCADPVAFFRLVEWCCKYRFAAACESAVSGDKWDVVLTRDGVTYPLVTAPTLPLALARAVYEAMKGT